MFSRALLLFAAALALACTATMTPAPPSGDGAEVDPQDCGQPVKPTPLRLLTRAEYNNTVRDLLGDTTAPADQLPREPLAHGLDNDADLNLVTADHTSRYLELAEAIAGRAVREHPERLFTCPVRNVACGEDFVRRFGRLAFRRALTSDEQTQLSSFFRTTLGATSFETAVEWTLQVMLQSPQFLYRFEAGIPMAPVMKRAPLKATDLATRLSYFLWASTPDDALLGAAERGELLEPKLLEAQVARMLADPRARDGLKRFFHLYLSLDAIPTAEKDLRTYPQYSAALGQSWKTSLELYLDEVLRTEGTVAALLTSNVLYANEAMSMYEVAPGGGGFQRLEMAQRVGLLTQPAFLAKAAGPDQSSPVRRGVFVLEKLLCQTPPPPPPSVNPTPPRPNTGTTTRERFQQHVADPACSGCHALFDPIGFTFENYDGLGRWRAQENGRPVDVSGAITYAAREPSLQGPLTGVEALARRLATSRQVHDCLAAEVTRFALGRGLTAGDACELRSLQEAFFARGGRFEDLVKVVVASPLFRTTPEVAP